MVMAVSMSDVQRAIVVSVSVAQRDCSLFAGVYVSRYC